jgi:hypothetical protein
MKERFLCSKYSNQDQYFQPTKPNCKDIHPQLQKQPCMLFITQILLPSKGLLGTYTTSCLCSEGAFTFGARDSSVESLITILVI